MDIQNLSLKNDFKQTDQPPGEKSEDLELSHKQYKRNLLTNAQKSFVYLENQSLVDCVEADDEYVVSAGRDHDINVWDVIGGGHLRRFTGHAGPVTGLYLTDDSSAGKIVISASEDGDIRKWSIAEGFLDKISTQDVITCMGIINNVLAVTGNNNGYMEVRHLESGELYSSILAHEDPIEALAVEGNYACSVVFDCPSSVKVWRIQFEQTVCVYRIENPPDVEFRSVALWNTTVVLGAADPTLHVIDFANDEKKTIDLGRLNGSVRHLRIWNEWVLSCCVYEENVVLDVHRIHNFEYFGTFNCNMKRVRATAAMEFDNRLQIILGGSSLAILSFDFILTQDVKAFKRFVKNTKNLEGNKSKSRYTLKNNVLDREDCKEISTDSEDNSGVKEAFSYLRPLSPQNNVQQDMTGPQEFRKMEDKPEIKDNKEMMKEFLRTQTSVKPTFPAYCIEEDIGSENTMNESLRTQVSAKPILPTYYEDIGSVNTFQTYAEPRVTVRKIRQLDSDDLKKLSKNASIASLEKALPKSGCLEAIEEARRLFLKVNLNEEKFKNVNGGDGLINTKKEANVGEITEKNNLHLSRENINKTGEENVQADHMKSLEHSKKFCFRKKENSKPDKKKMAERKKRKKCCIM